MTAALTIHQVSKQFGNMHALRDVSMQIEQGEYFGLLGPNGAGKSTLINIIGGLTASSQGRAEVMGFDVQKQYRLARLAVGIVPQELVFDPFFTVRNMLRLQSDYFGQGAKNFAWVDELIERLELTDKADSTLRELSGGMKRRVLIAQAMVHNPDVLILDEPTAGVDVQLRQTLWRFTRELHQQGKTIVLTTHYLEEAEALCDRIAILRAGKVEALESKETLISRQRKRYLTISLETTLSADAIPIDLSAHVESIHNDELKISISNDGLSINAVLDLLAKHHIAYKDLQTSNPTLEEVFLDIVNQGESTWTG